MTTPPQQPPLPTPSSIRSASTLIAPYIHRTPLLTCATLNRLANTPLARESQPPSFSLFFKTENLQKIGAFKARGAHHALLRLIERLGLETVRQRGVVTHSSGNHAQALALAASTLGVKCTIVMPRISTKSKIEGTRLYCSDVIFSGSTSVEREAVVGWVQERTRAILVPPYDDFEIIAGQGTVGLEMEEQYAAMKRSEKVAREREEEEERNGRVKIKLKEARDKDEFERGMDGWFERWKAQKGLDPENEHQEERASQPTDGKTRAMCSEALSSSSSTNLDTSPALDAVIAPLGGGGLLGGIATYFSRPPSTASTSQQRKTLVFGAEPQFQGANDAELGLMAGKRVEHVSTLTIADGLRTPVGELNWKIISDREKVEGVYSVTEEQIKQAMRLVFERMKLVVEPSGCVGLAVVLYNEPFRKMVAEKQRVEGSECWDVGIVFSGGNTTMEAIVALYSEEERPRDEGTVGMDGKKEVEDVAG